MLSSRFEDTFSDICDDGENAGTGFANVESGFANLETGFTSYETAIKTIIIKLVTHSINLKLVANLLAAVSTCSSNN